MAALTDAHAKLELALAEALERITEVGTPAEIERFTKLLIHHKIVAEMLFGTIQAGQRYAQAGDDSSTGAKADATENDEGAGRAIEAAEPEGAAVYATEAAKNDEGLAFAAEAAKLEEETAP